MVDTSAAADNGDADLVDAERLLPTALWERLRAPYDKEEEAMKHMMIDADAVLDWLEQSKSKSHSFRIKRKSVEHKIVEPLASETKMVESKTVGLTSTKDSTAESTTITSKPASKIASGAVVWYRTNRGYEHAEVVGRKQVH